MQCEEFEDRINAVLDEPAIKSRMADLGSDPFASTPAEFTKLVDHDIAKWDTLIKQVGARVD